MAIFEHIPGLEVTVEVDGVTATEYDNPDNPDEEEEPSQTHTDFHLANPNRPLPHIVKYIEAKSGAPFAFRIKGTKDLPFADHVIIFHDFVDGQYAARTISPDKSRESWEIKMGKLRVQTGETQKTSSGFRFGNLHVGDVRDIDPTDLRKKVDEAKHWGVLMLKCYHGATPQPYTKARRLGALPPPKDDSVSEKVLKGKALDCITTFDHPTTSYSRRRDRRTPYTDRKKRPFVIFEFRYRSHKGLIDEGVIPPPPAPTAAERVREMGDDEVRRLAEELLAEKERAETSAIKHEAKRGIKREINLTDEVSSADFESRYKSRRRRDGQVEIDLTDD